MSGIRNPIASNFDRTMTVFKDISVNIQRQGTLSRIA